MLISDDVHATLSGYHLKKGHVRRKTCNYTLNPQSVVLYLSVSSLSDLVYSLSSVDASTHHVIPAKLPTVDARGDKVKHH